MFIKYTFLFITLFNTCSQDVLLCNKHISRKTKKKQTVVTNKMLYTYLAFNMCKFSSSDLHSFAYPFFCFNFVRIGKKGEIAGEKIVKSLTVLLL